MYLAGTQFTLNSGHNPLTHLREQKNPRGKLGWWLSELEEYSYDIKYIPGKDNVKADTLSHNTATASNQPISNLEHKIYAMFADNANFLTHLREEQVSDPSIHAAILHVTDNSLIPMGRFK